MQISPSKYNYLYSCENKFTVLNGFTGNSLTMPLDKYRTLFEFFNKEGILSFQSNEQGTLLDSLIKNGFIVRSESNEVEKIKKLIAQRNELNNTLSLVYVLTHQCNMKCLYCYQEYNGYIDRSNILHRNRDDQLLFFLKSKAQGYQKISLRLYGGEPLLEYNRIINLLYKVNKFCDSAGLDFIGDIVTNGYLLSPEVCKKLTFLGITKYEISLDGTQYFHDKRRPTLNGNSSFETIMKSIDFLTSMGNFVILRSNIDGTNRMNIYKLIEEVKTRRLKVTFKFSPIDGPKEYLEERGLRPFSIEEFSKAWWDLVLHATKNGFNVIDSWPKIFYQKCPAMNKDFFIVDGCIVHKCFQEIGNYKRAVYNILSNNIEKGKYGSIWEQWSPFKDKQCTDCRYLPICLGGCPYYKISKLLDYTSGNIYKRIESCSKWRYMPENIVPAFLQMNNDKYGDERCLQN